MCDIMKINVQRLWDKDEGEKLWNGRDSRQVCSSSIGSGERGHLLRKLSNLLEAYGTVSNAAWGSADFHFNPDPDPSLPCFVQIVFRVWPKGVLREIVLFVEEYRRITGRQFYIYIDKGPVLLAVLSGGNVIFYVVGGEVDEATAMVDIEQGIAEI